MSEVAFARRAFQVAGWYGLLVLVPQYLLEQRIGIEQPPAITHPEFFYGFIGVGAAWQVAFLIIALDPVRYRLLMVPGILEKLSFACAVVALIALGRAPSLLGVAAAIDLVFALAFLLAFLRLGRMPR